MLQTIREHTQGWIAGIIITLIILSFALWGIHSYFIGGGVSNIVAEVNGVDITKEQLSIAYERLRRQVQAQLGTNNSFNKNESALKNRALEALIEVEVLRQGAYEQGFRISNTQTENYLQTIPEFQVDGQFSTERFQEILATTLLSVGEFINLLQTSLLIDQPKLGIVYTSYSLPDETNYAISLINQERDIEYMEVPLSYFLSMQPAISKDKINQYYKAHQNEFMTPEQVKVDYVELSLKDLSDKVDVSDTTLKSFYDENINLFTQPKQWKILAIEVPFRTNSSKADLAKAQAEVDSILAEIKASKDFNQLAIRHPAGLSADWISLTQVPDELKKIIVTLKTNEVSPPIKTAKGFIIIKVMDEKAPETLSFDKAKEKAKQVYAHQQAEEKFAEKREQLASLSYEHPDSLEEVSKALNLSILTSEFFAKEQKGKDISQYKRVRDIAFSNDILNLQNNSDVIQINPQTMVVLRIKSHLPAAKLSLNAVTKDIEEKLKRKESETRAESFIQDLKTKLNKGANAQQLADKYKFSWVKPGYISRYTNKVDAAILDLAFRLPNPERIKTKLSFGTIRMPNGYAVIALKSVRKGSVDPKQYGIFAEQVQLSEGQLEYELYKRSQMNEAKIKSNY